MIVAAPERWDEACFAVPAIRAMARSGLVGALVCREEQEAFWKTASDLPRILFSQKTSASQLAAKLNDSWEAALCWELGLAAKAIAKAKIQRRLGPAHEPRLKKFLTHPLEAREAVTEHRVRLYLNTAEELGIPVSQPEFFVPASLGIPAKPQTVLLCPGSDFGPSHEWHVDSWQILAETLLDKGKHLTIAGEIGGRGLGKSLAYRLGDQAEFLHLSPISAALPALAEYQWVIAADSSIPHLAAFTGATCITLFGPNDANWKRPLGKQHVVVKNHVECAPCLSPKCQMDNRCQNELKVSYVLAALPGR